MKWISVTHSLPIIRNLDDAPNVIITDGKEISLGWYEHNLEETDEKGVYFPEEQLWHDNSNILNTDYAGWPKVTHWMPLPKTPEQS